MTVVTLNSLQKILVYCANHGGLIGPRELGWVTRCDEQSNWNSVRRGPGTYSVSWCQMAVTAGKHLRSE